MQHLADLFPKAGLAIPHGHRQRGAYLGGSPGTPASLEPVLIVEAAGLDHPFLRQTFRGGAEARERLASALGDSPFLLGDRFTAADLLLHSPFAWFGKPGVPAIDAWVDRCTARPGAAFAAAFDAAQPAT